MKPFSQYKIIKEESDLFGLSYIPKFEVPDLNEKDCILQLPVTKEHFTELDQFVLSSAIQSVNPRTILEIGVHRPRAKKECSSTTVIIGNKSEEAIYIGVDKREVGFVKKWGKNIHTVCCDSLEYEKVMREASSVGIEEFDFIFIDGLHSLSQVTAEWRYVQHLSSSGAVAFHDTTTHPGPYLIFEAVDESLFEKTKYGDSKDDYGIATFFRKKK